MSQNARAKRTPLRGLVLILGLLFVAALGAVAIATQARAQSAPPEELTEEKLLSRITAAPEDAPDFEATVTVEQTLVPEGLLGASQGDRAENSGPRSARVWYDGPDKVRSELQGENGDRLFVKNGSEVRAYDGATNTLRTGEKPETAEQRPEEAASPEKINEVLAEISPNSDLRTGPPVRFADRWAYPLTLEPRDKSLTLVERAEALVDTEAFVPLSFELYAEDASEPVVRYEASEFEVGSVPDERFQLETPPGATVESMEEPGKDGERGERGGENRESQRVASVAEAQEAVGFPVRQLANAPGGRELVEIRVAGSDGVVQTYGEGWGTVALVQKPDREPESADQSQVDSDREANGEGDGRDEQLQIPTVDLGGVEAKEISTPIGTSLSWSANGVSYSLVGSVPAAELEEAARGLLRQAP
jgi:outer membrane lipoprotein-sorting protein